VARAYRSRDRGMWVVSSKKKGRERGLVGDLVKTMEDSVCIYSRMESHDRDRESTLSRVRSGR